MSNNIKDTDVKKVKEQVDLFLKEISHKIQSRMYYETKYSYLFTTSKTLFEFIYKNHASMNKEKFDSNITTMLDYIRKIQKYEITQNTASEIIGTSLGEQFIPQIKK